MKAVHRYILTLTCPDRVGIVATVSELIASLNGWVTEANYHSDQDSGLFFMRNEIKADSIGDQIEAFKAGIRAIAIDFNTRQIARPCTGGENNMSGFKLCDLTVLFHI